MVVELKILTKQFVSLPCDRQFELNLGHDDGPLSVLLHDNDGNEVHLPVEFVEQVAAFIAQKRLTSLDDNREVCPAHGYFEPGMGCSVCKPAPLSIAVSVKQ